jgi:hypothetical protein
MIRTRRAQGGSMHASQEIDVATQRNICAANQDTSEHSTTYVQPIMSEKKIGLFNPATWLPARDSQNEYTPRTCQLFEFHITQ